LYLIVTSYEIVTTAPGRLAIRSRGTAYAQDVAVEALEVAEILEDAFLFKALANLPFGQGTQAESKLYSELISLAKQRGLHGELKSFLDHGTCSYDQSGGSSRDQLDILLGV
jgi:hypothetical protein